MGKTAENERIKLKASYLNSLSVGVHIAGFFVPILAFMPRVDGVARAVTKWPLDITVSEVFWSVGTVLALWVSFGMGHRLRDAADEEIQKLQD